MMEIFFFQYKLKKLIQKRKILKILKIITYLEKVDSIIYKILFCKKTWIFISGNICRFSHFLLQSFAEPEDRLNSI